MKVLTGNICLRNQLQVDLSVEITRLQDSLRRLRETQDFLKEHLEISENKDPELVRALQENETTMYVNTYYVDCDIIELTQVVEVRKTRELSC